MKVLIVGDFGGEFPKRLYNAIKKEKPDLILSTGDFSDIKEIKKLFLKYKGNYQDKITPTMHKRVRKKQRESGMKVLQQLNSLRVPTMLVLGNNDWMKSDYFKKYIKKRKYLIDSENRLRVHKKIRVFGWSGDMGLMYEAKNRRKEEWNYLKKRLNKVKKPFIFLTHLPPKNCKLDINLNKKFNYKKHVGDEVINDAILKYKPEIHFCGHLEEHTGECKKRGIRIINPGAAERAQYAIMHYEGNYKKAKIEYKKVTPRGKIVKARTTV